MQVQIKVNTNTFGLFYFHDGIVKTWCAVTVFTKPVCSPRSHLKDRQCKRPVWVSALPLTSPPPPPVQTKRQLFNFNYVLTKRKMTPIWLKVQAANTPTPLYFNLVFRGWQLCVTVLLIQCQRLWSDFCNVRAVWYDGCGKVWITKTCTVLPKYCKVLHVPLRDVSVYIV